MKIGEVIRKYRKELNMTQEEMASRLGVTTPAVNKWENGNSCPDIMLLAPIARLLNITLDTLLSFQNELTQEEIVQIVQEADELFAQRPYEEVYEWITKKIACYPNCDVLIWQLAVMLDSQRLVKKIENPKLYDAYILKCYERVLGGKDEGMVTCAADSLFLYYFRQEKYEMAESYLSYFSEQNPERKRKQAMIYSKIGEVGKAYKAYEEMLFSGYQTLNMVLASLSHLALEEGKVEKARKYVNKLSKLAHLFEMGKYHEIACQLDIAAFEQNPEEIKRLETELLEVLETVSGFTEAELYEHMNFKRVNEDFVDRMRRDLEDCFNEIND